MAGNRARPASARNSSDTFRPVGNSASTPAVSRDADRLIWVDGELRPWAAATVHVLSHSLQRGSLVFDYMSVHETPHGAAVFRLQPHIERFFHSCALMGLPVSQSPELVREAICATVRANPGARAVKLSAYFASIEIDVVPIDTHVTIAIAAYDPKADISDRLPRPSPPKPQHLKLWIEKETANRRDDIVSPQAKVSANYASPMTAKLRARASRLRRDHPGRRGRIPRRGSDDESLPRRREGRAAHARGCESAPRCHAQLDPRARQVRGHPVPRDAASSGSAARRRRSVPDGNLRGRLADRVRRRQRARRSLSRSDLDPSARPLPTCRERGGSGIRPLAHARHGVIHRPEKSLNRIPPRTMSSQANESKLLPPKRAQIVLSGTKPTGENLHIGNYFGALRQYVDLQDQHDTALYFIADYHSMTSLRNGPERRRNTPQRGPRLPRRRPRSRARDPLPPVATCPRSPSSTWILSTRHAHGAARARARLQGQDRQGRRTPTTASSPIPC